MLVRKIAGRKQRVLLLGSLSLLLLAQLPSAQAAPVPSSSAIANPILFVSQVPIPDDYTTIGSVFGNQRADLDSAGRGGDLWIRYANGTLKNLTSAAGFGTTGFQGANAIAVRDPAVHWSGNKAVFSMVVGAPAQQYQEARYVWQLYEVSGLGQMDTPIISKVPNQPAGFNNISPLYGTDERIIFTSDRPRNGSAALYPQLDEYEEAPTVSGLWSLDRASGDLFMLNHAPSGAFTPILDSFGRVIFTRWDHLQRDQQADADALGTSNYGTFNYADESANAAPLANRNEIFPEPRSERTDLLAGTNLVGQEINHFFPWQIGEDGAAEETLNHIGRHELHAYIPNSLNDDPNIVEYYGQYPRVNPNPIENFLQIKEDPLRPGVYFGVDAPEFQTHASGQIISIDGAPAVNAAQMTVTYVTARVTADVGNGPDASLGHYRDPLPLSDGTLLAAHTAEMRADLNLGSRAAPRSRYDFRLTTLRPAGNLWLADQPLTNGISKTISYYDPDVLVTYSGPLWELQPVEVRARPKPARLTASLPLPEQQAFNRAGVPPALVQQYLVQNNLAIVVSRNVTTRDAADRQQPFNLRIAGTGVQTLGAAGKLYDIAHIQFFQADQIRGLTFGDTSPRAGRRVLAQLLHDPAVHNPPNASGPPSSVALGADGSMAAFVPARRALSWQTTDPSGVPVVRERYWLTFQPGEIRVCTSCHGLNETDQAGHAMPTNSPKALEDLLGYWKTTSNLTAVNVTLATQPSGLYLVANQQTITTPQTLVWYAGYSLTLSAPPQLDAVAQRWMFQHWSDGGALTHAVSPSAPATYTASFTKALGFWLPLLMR